MARLEAELVEAPVGPDLVAAMGTDGGLAAGRAARGTRCFAARVAGEMVAYAWVSTGAEWIGEIEAAIRLPPGEAYVWNCVTLPPYRRRRLYTALLGVVAGTLRAEGMGRLWVATLVTVPYAGRGVAAAGFRPVLRVLCVRACGLRLLWSRADRRAGGALAGAARRALGRGTRLDRRPARTAH